MSTLHVYATKAVALREGDILLFVYSFVRLFVRLLKRVLLITAGAYRVVHSGRTDLLKLRFPQN